MVAALRNARTAESTKHTHRSALPLYEASCQKLALPPWPPTDRTLEVFAGYLKESEAYLNPAVYFWAIVEHGRCSGAAVPLERSFIRSLVTGLEEQAEPMTIGVLRQLGAAVTTAKDLLVVRTLVAAVFSVARADSFIS